MGRPTKEAKKEQSEPEDVEEEDDDGKTLSSLRQPKKKAAAAQSANGTRTKAASKIKKEEPKDEDDEEDEIPFSTKVPLSLSFLLSPFWTPSFLLLLERLFGWQVVESKDKRKVRKEKHIEKEENAKKRKRRTVGEKEKKVYDLPGQKHDPPEQRDPLRIFYESLYKQLPESEMAAFW
ncbi:hypothetical protein ACLOJK_034576 [Asimina triloba]